MRRDIGRNRSDESSGNPAGNSEIVAWLPCPDSVAKRHAMNVRSIFIHVTEAPMLGTCIRLYRHLQELWNQILEDWTVNNRDWTMPGFRAIAIHRFGTWLAARRSGALKSGLLTLYRMMYRYIRNHYGVEIPLTVALGRRVWLVHQHGIVFHWKSEIGDDCLIRHGATIGAGYGGQKTLHKGPKLGRRVEVGPGAVIFAGVKIGDDAVIGPNAVVMSDVPAGARVFAEAPRVIHLPTAHQAGLRT